MPITPRARTQAKIKRWNVQTAESKGLIADSFKERFALMALESKGLISREDAKSYLKSLQKNARSNSKITMRQASGT